MLSEIIELPPTEPTYKLTLTLTPREVRILKAIAFLNLSIPRFLEEDTGGRFDGYNRREVKAVLNQLAETLKDTK